MKNLNTILSKAFFVFLILTAISGFAQKTFSLDTKPELKLTGTSSLHDWEMTSRTATGKLEGNVENNKLTTIKSLVVEMPSESIKSGKSGMDKNAYKAIQTDKFKTIKFELKSSSKQIEGTWNLTGVFTIAGVTKQVTIKAKETSTAGLYSFEGTYSFKLTDYKITPPTALMGTVKTGDDVNISFKVKFK
jgi:polyisoprenoid-binding protein YceI